MSVASKVPDEQTVAPRLLWEGTNRILVTAPIAQRAPSFGESRVVQQPARYENYSWDSNLTKQA